MSAWSGQESGGAASTPDCSAGAKTPNWWRWWAAPRDKTENRAAEFGTTPYLDLHQMLEEQNPDLVSLCLPNEHHFETTMQTIEAGFPLLVEKPFVFDLEESERLLAEAEKRSLFFAINFNHRYAVPVMPRPCGDRELGSWARSSSPPGDSAERPGRASTLKRTSSKRSVTASTCSSTCAARSRA